MTSARQKTLTQPQQKGRRRIKVTRMDMIGLSIVYMAMSPLVAMPFYNKLLFFPTHDRWDVSDAISEIEARTNSKKINLTIPSGTGQKLDAWYFKKQNAQKVILLSHGNGGNISYRTSLALTLLSCGASVIMYDYQGYGQSTGEPSVRAIKQDGLAAYDYVRNNLHYQPKDIVLYGESLGSGVTVNIAAHRPAGGIIIQSGFASLSSAARERLWWMGLYPDFALQNFEMDNVAYLRGVHAPFLLIHGTEDKTLPVHHADTMFAEATQPKQFLRIKKAGHNNTHTLGAKVFTDSVTHFVTTLP